MDLSRKATTILLRYQSLLIPRRLKLNHLVVSCRNAATNTQAPKKDEKKETKVDDIKYIVSFKKTDIKSVFKDFYSLYGPLFVVCHIGVGLTSLGFFCSLVWLSIDPVAYMPEVLLTRLGETALNMTGGSSKFLVAYAIHKLILPVRLGAAILLTRKLSPKIQSLRKLGKKEN